MLLGLLTSLIVVAVSKISSQPIVQRYQAHLQPTFVVTISKVFYQRIIKLLDLLTSCISCKPLVRCIVSLLYKAIRPTYKTYLQQLSVRYLISLYSRSTYTLYWYKLLVKSLVNLLCKTIRLTYKQSLQQLLVMVFTSISHR